MKTIGFFSSDARMLYKVDIFRVLSLPKQSVIHFRYDAKYVAKGIIDDIKKYIGKVGVVFYRIGN